MTVLKRVEFRIAIGFVGIGLLSIFRDNSLAADLPSAALLAQGNINPPPGQPFGPPAPFGPPGMPQPPGAFPTNSPPGAPPVNGPAAQPAAAKNGRGVGGALGGAVSGAIIGILLFLVLWALRRTARAPAKVDPATGGAVVEFSRGLRMLMAGFSLFTPSAFVVAAVFLPPENATAYIIIAIAVLLFGALGGSVCWGLFKARFIATQDGLIAESGWKRRRTLPWSEVNEVVYDKRSGGLLFRGPNKRANVCISPLMAGLKPLVVVMRQHLPAAKYEKAAEFLGRVDQLQGGNAMPFMGAVGTKPAAKPKT